MIQKIFNVKSIVQKSFHRCGMEFGKEPREFLPGELSDRQIETLSAETKLKCWYSEPTPEQREWIASRVLVAVDPGAGSDMSAIAVLEDGKITMLTQVTRVGQDEGIEQAFRQNEAPQENAAFRTLIESVAPDVAAKLGKSTGKAATKVKKEEAK